MQGSQQNQRSRRIRRIVVVNNYSDAYQCNSQLPFLLTFMQAFAHRQKLELQVIRTNENISFNGRRRTRLSQQQQDIVRDAVAVVCSGSDANVDKQSQSIVNMNKHIIAICKSRQIPLVCICYSFQVLVSMLTNKKPKRYIRFNAKTRVIPVQNLCSNSEHTKDTPMDVLVAQTRFFKDSVLATLDAKQSVDVTYVSSQQRVQKLQGFVYKGFITAYNFHPEARPNTRRVLKRALLLHIKQ